MGKIYTEFEVHVQVERPWNCKGWPLSTEALDQYRRDAQEVAKQIERRVDGYSRNGVNVTGVEPSCSFCGNCWTEDDPKYNGGCCKEDEKNNPAPSGREGEA